uniref:MULE transposase domain-containing protein n=1 Tax=Lactuca sativa TaxID=4236 RepID=A0A9R1VE97_LACSA|nr:hypothetical protein LSAT_V11C500277710 [Lactuca sativa]
MEGCRRIIGLDGCFLKGICKGELLCVVGRDANDKIYPIAWVVVCVENKQNWKWFLELLIEDMHLNLGNGFSLMSDQHKGLIDAVKELLPYVEHMQCAGHICQNLQKRFNAAIYHTLFWRASKATTKNAFKFVIKEIETLNPDAHQYLIDKVPKTWCRAFFQPGRCCDAVKNGFSESFNLVIVNTRKKPIITMFEEIRFYMMVKLYNMRDVEAYMNNMYNTTTFIKAYNYRIAPMNESDMWPQTNYDPPLPPISRRMPVRLATSRKKSTTWNKGKHKVYKPTSNDSESSSVGGYGQYMQVTPPRSYEVEDFVGEDVEVENVEGDKGQANGVVEDGQGQANDVFEDGQSLVSVVVEEAVEVPNVQQFKCNMLDQFQIF